MYNSVPPQLWMQLDKKVRHHLVEIFKIPRTGITEIYNEEIRADGYSIDDLKAISLDKMIAYIGSEETFPRAWEMSCAKANSELNPEVVPMADEPKETPTGDVTTITSDNMDELQNKTKTNDSTKKENKQK